MVTIREDGDGASSVLAVVLMMGFVAAASVSLFVVGTATVSETKDTAQERQVENTFRQFNKDVSSVAFGRQKYRSMQFDIQDQTAAFRQEDTGQIRIEVDGVEKVDRSVGALVYESNGETIAYQAGGVWRGTGRDSRMVSKPPVEYQNGSLTFPIPVLGGDDEIREGELNINKRKTESPINDESYFDEGRLVTLYITSEYYMGWAEYFRTQTNDVAVSVDHSPAGDKGTVKVKLGKPVANGNFENGVLATGGDDGDILLDSGSAEITNGPVAATGDIRDNTGGIPDDQERPNQESNLYELDEAIDRKVDETEENADPEETVNLESGGSLDGGKTYYSGSGFTLDGETIDVDLGGGNVTLVIDGDMTLKSHADIDVDPEGTDHTFRIYTTGDLSLEQSEFGADWGEGAKYTQIYGTSEMLVALNGGNNVEFVGTVYAPRDEPALDPSGENGQPNSASQLSNGKCDGWDVCVTTGSSNVKGAIIAGPTKFAQSSGLTYDSDLETIQPTMELDNGVLPPPITFLKVSVHTVAVNNSGAGNIAPAGDLGAPASVASPPTTGSGFATGTAPAAVAAPEARSARAAGR